MKDTSPQKRQLYNSTFSHTEAWFPKGFTSKIKRSMTLPYGDTDKEKNTLITFDIH